MEKTININELKDIIAKHFEYDVAYITKAYTASVDIRLGAGSILNITVDLYNRKESNEQSN